MKTLPKMFPHLLRGGAVFVLFMTLLLWGTHSHAQGQWSPIPADKVPDAVKTTFAETHAKATNVAWGMRYSGNKKLYHATGMEGSSHLKCTFEENGSVLGKIYSLETHEIPDNIKTLIKAVEGEGWKLDMVYHHLNTKVDSYRAFFYNDADQSRKVEWNETGKKLNDHIKKKGGKHSAHHHTN